MLVLKQLKRISGASELSANVPPTDASPIRWNHKESEQITYFLSSMRPLVLEQAKLARDYWRFESQLHWSLDMTFNEDQRRDRKNNGAAIAGFISRLTLSILQQNTLLQKMKLPTPHPLFCQSLAKLLSVEQHEVSNGDH